MCEVTRLILLALILMSVLSRASAAQAPAVGYNAEHLHCARFLEIGESRILTEAGGRIRNQTSARRGFWQFRAAPSPARYVLSCRTRWRR